MARSSLLDSRLLDSRLPDSRLPGSSLPRPSLVLAVRLPAEFRFEGTEVYIRRDPVTGDVILSPRPESWRSFFELANQAGVPDDFLSNRGDAPPQERGPF